MRWRPDQPGDTRIVEKFLWWPTTLPHLVGHKGCKFAIGRTECRWLETAKIRQLAAVAGFGVRWIASAWADDEATDDEASQ